MDFLFGLLKFLGPMLFDGIERLYRSWSRDRSLKKLGYKEAVEKGHAKKKKVLTKVEKKRAHIRSNAAAAADKLQSKFTLRK